jgi:predicted nucleic acid-binding protein
VIHVFIDTNVYLTFFSFAEDDLEELRKLRVAIENGDVKLWVPAQTRDELRRNREGKVAESMGALRKLKPTGGIPQMARNLPEFEAFKKARTEFDRHLNVLDEQLSEQAVASDLAADRVLAELLEAAETVEGSAELLNSARRRTEVGNPPGKKGSLGDAINWECLLASCPHGEDLYLVTQDGDFVSKMDKERVSGFLAEEWRGAKSSEVRLYRRISSLFQDKFPDIRLAAEFEKELRIRRLTESPSFERTHRAITALSAYTEFSEQQARDLLEGACSNSQVRAIAHDHDVQQFLRGLLDRYRDAFEADEVARFERRLGLGDEDAADADEDGGG